MGARPYPGPDLSRERHAASHEFGRFPDGRYVVSLSITPRLRRGTVSVRTAEPRDAIHGPLTRHVRQPVKPLASPLLVLYAPALFHLHPPLGSIYFPMTAKAPP